MIVDDREVPYAKWRTTFEDLRQAGYSGFSTSSGLNPGDNAKGYRFMYESKEGRLYSPILGGGTGRYMMDAIAQGVFEAPGVLPNEAQENVYYFPSRDESERYLNLTIQSTMQIEGTGPAPEAGYLTIYEVEGTEGAKPSVLADSDAGAVMSELHYVKPVLRVSVDEIGRHGWKPGSYRTYESHPIKPSEPYEHPAAEEW